MHANRLLYGSALALLLASSSVAFAQATKEAPSAYQPMVGQEGKDVVWVPTPQDRKGVV